MLCGKLPFDSTETKREDKINEIYTKTMHGDFSFPSDEDRLKHGRHPISAEAQDLIRAILCVDPDNRPRIGEIMTHKFFTAPSDGFAIDMLP